MKKISPTCRRGVFLAAILAGAGVLFVVGCTHFDPGEIPPAIMQYRTTGYGAPAGMSVGRTLTPTQTAVVWRILENHAGWYARSGESGAYLGPTREFSGGLVDLIVYHPNLGATWGIERMSCILSFRRDASDRFHQVRLDPTPEETLQLRALCAELDSSPDPRAALEDLEIFRLEDPDKTKPGDLSPGLETDYSGQFRLR